jgi:hypothetical protein
MQFQVEFEDYIPKSGDILDAATGLFISGREFCEGTGQLSLPGQYLVIDGVILENGSEMISNKSINFDGNLSSLKRSLSLADERLQKLSDQCFEEGYDFRLDEVLGSVFYDSSTSSDLVPQRNKKSPSISQTQSEYGSKQIIIPDVYNHIVHKFTQLGCYVVKRTIDGKGATFRICAKCVKHLMVLPDILKDIHDASPIDELSLHVMLRKKIYKKGLTCYIKIKDEKDSQMIIDVAKSHGVDMCLVSNKPLFGQDDEKIKSTNLFQKKVVEKTKLNSASSKMEPKKSIQGKEIKIVHKKINTDKSTKFIGFDDSTTSLEDASLLLPARPMMKKKSSVMTVMLPATGHITSLNVEGVNDASFTADVPHLDLQSLSMLKDIIAQNLETFIKHEYKTRKPHRL